MQFEACHLERNIAESKNLGICFIGVGESLPLAFLRGGTPQRPLKAIVVGLNFERAMCKICTCDAFLQFAFLINIPNVFSNNSSVFLEHFCHLH